MRKKKILIFGAGGHGRVILDILLSDNQEVFGFIDEEEKKKGLEIRSLKVWGDWNYLKKNENFKIALGIGDNEIRASIYERVKHMGFDVVTAIHPKAIVSKDVTIGEGVVIMPGAVINPGTVIETGVVVNTGATVDHDCYLRKFCQIWPGANLAGSVEVGEFSYVGTGAAVIKNIRIGRDVIVGAGAVVIKDIPDRIVVAGMPARKIKNRQ